MGLGRYSACIFHLMRAMEIALRAVNICLGAPSVLIGSEKNWGTILKRMRDARDAKAKNWKEKDIFAEIYALLDAVKDAWRNATMHVENKYNEEEAVHIFILVRGFMQKIAYRMDESGLPLA